MMKLIVLLVVVLICNNNVEGFKLRRIMSMKSSTSLSSMKKVATSTLASMLFLNNIPLLNNINPSYSTIARAADLPKVGTDAPDFNLPTNAGSNISKKDLLGKTTVLYFYPGDFTQGCTIEAQAFQRDFDKYKALGAQIIGVSVDSVDKHLDFAKTYGLSFQLASDQGGAVSNSFGSLLDLGFIGKFSNRQTYIINSDGKIAAVFTDVESRLAKHSEEVLKKLSELKG